MITVKGEDKMVRSMRGSFKDVTLPERLGARDASNEELWIPKVFARESILDLTNF